MISAGKVAAAILFGSSLLGFWAWEYKASSVPERAISVSLEAACCKVNGSEGIKIALKSEVEGFDLHYGRVVLKFWSLGDTASKFPNRLQRIEGYTDQHGRFVSLWHPPIPGRYLICARVSKPGCACGQAMSRFVASK